VWCSGGVAAAVVAVTYADSVHNERAVLRHAVSFTCRMSTALVATDYSSAAHTRLSGRCVTASVYNYLTSAQITASSSPQGDCPTHRGAGELTDLEDLTGDSGNW